MNEAEPTTRLRLHVSTASRRSKRTEPAPRGHRSCAEPILPGTMIEDYLVEFNGKRFEAVDGGMKPNEPVEVVIRPEDLRITLPEEGKLQVKVDTQLFRGVHYEIIAYDELGNEWMIHSTRKAIVGEEIGLDFEPEDIHIMRLNETEEEFDARIEEYVEIEEHEAGLINAIEEERDEENNL